MIEKVINLICIYFPQSLLITFYGCVTDAGLNKLAPMHTTSRGKKMEFYYEKHSLCHWLRELYFFKCMPSNRMIKLRQRTSVTTSNQLLFYSLLTKETLSLSHTHIQSGMNSCLSLQIHVLPLCMSVKSLSLSVFFRGWLGGGVRMCLHLDLAGERVKNRFSRIPVAMGTCLSSRE